MSDATRTNPLTALVPRLAGAWLLAGALFKLFAGTPADLPPVVRDLPLELGLTYNLAITVELCVAALAFLRPRWAWLLLIGAFVTFDAVLLTMIGDESCKCFGSTITLPPWVMLAIDSTFLLLLIVTKPWKNLRPGGANFVLVVGALALGVVLPWVLDRQASDAPSSAANERGPVDGQWLELDIENWVGKDVWDTPLYARMEDSSNLPLDGLWVIYRSTCEHCAEHLATLQQTEVGARMVTLIRLKERTDTEANRVVHAVPTGDFVQHVALPDTLDYIIQTPGDMELEGGRIVSAREAAGEEH